MQGAAAATAAMCARASLQESKERSVIMEDIVIVSAVRTAVGKFGGTLAKIPATELGSIVIREALNRAKVGTDQVGEVIMGQVLAAGAGQNPARQAMMKAGVAKETDRKSTRLNSSHLV